jgi:hypothetical protein
MRLFFMTRHRDRHHDHGVNASSQRVSFTNPKSRSCATDPVRKPILQAIQHLQAMQTPLRSLRLPPRLQTCLRGLQPLRHHPQSKRYRTTLCRSASTPNSFTTAATRTPSGKHERTHTVSPTFPTTNAALIQQTSRLTPAHVRFRGKADMTLYGNPLLRSLLRVKRTWAVALHMSTYDPKRT